MTSSEQVNFCQLLDFSLQSAANKSHVASMGLVAKSLHWQLASGRSEIRVTLAKHVATFFVLSQWEEPARRLFLDAFGRPRRVAEPPAFELANIVVDGATEVPVRLVRSPILSTRDWYCCPEGASEVQRLRLVEDITRHLIDVFSPKTFSLNTTGIFDCFVWDVTRHFSSLGFTGVPGEPVSAEAMRFLLEDVTTETTFLDTSASGVEAGFSYTTPLRGDVLLLTYGPWLKTEALLEMKCHRLILHIPPEEQIDVTPILKAWTEGHLPQLQMLQIRGKRPIYAEEQLPVLSNEPDPSTTPRDRFFMSFLPKDTDVRIQNPDGKIGYIEAESDSFFFHSF